MKNQGQNKKKKQQQRQRQQQQQRPPQHDERLRRAAAHFPAQLQVRAQLDTGVRGDVMGLEAPGEIMTYMQRVALVGKWSTPQLQRLDFSNLRRLNLDVQEGSPIALSPLFELLANHEHLEMFSAIMCTFEDKDRHALNQTASAFSKFIKTSKKLRWLELEECVSRAVSMLHIIYGIIQAPQLQKVNISHNFEYCSPQSFNETTSLALDQFRGLKMETKLPKNYRVMDGIGALLEVLFLKCTNLIQCSIFPDDAAVVMLHEQGRGCGEEICDKLLFQMSDLFSESVGMGNPLCYPTAFYAGSHPFDLRAFLLGLNVAVTWTPAKHPLFQQTFRVMVRTFLLCVQQLRPVLPKWIVHHVIAFLAFNYPIASLYVDSKNLLRPAGAPEKTWFQLMEETGMNLREMRERDIEGQALLKEQMLGGDQILDADAMAELTSMLQASGIKM